MSFTGDAYGMGVILRPTFVYYLKDNAPPRGMP